jgi:uncharacterized protein
MVNAALLGGTMDRNERAPTGAVARIGIRLATVAMMGILAFGFSSRQVSDAGLLASEVAPEELIRALVEAPAGQPVEIDWRTLAGLNYESGEMTDAIRAVNGRLVKIPGFMVPLEDFAEQVTEFLLVPYFGACIHTPPPPPNQIVHVFMDGNRKAQIEWWEPIWIEGTLVIEDVESIYGVSGYRLTGMRIAPYSN